MREGGNKMNFDYSMNEYVKGIVKDLNINEISLYISSDMNLNQEYMHSILFREKVGMIAYFSYLTNSSYSN